MHTDITSHMAAIPPSPAQARAPPTPKHTLARPNVQTYQWTDLATSPTDFLKVFSVKVFDLAGLVIRTYKTKALPLGFDTQIVQVVTQAEIQSAAKRFKVKCDECGWLGANELSLKSHKALQCPRILNSGGKVYEVHCVVDDATCDSRV